MLGVKQPVAAVTAPQVEHTGAIKGEYEVVDGEILKGPHVGV